MGRITAIDQRAAWNTLFCNLGSANDPIAFGVDRICFRVPNQHFADFIEKNIEPQILELFAARYNLSIFQILPPMESTFWARRISRSLKIIA